MCTTSATMAAKLKIVASKLACWHVSTQDNLAHEHISRQGTLACKQTRHVCTRARRLRWHVSTFLARRARNLVDSFSSIEFTKITCICVNNTFILLAEFTTVISFTSLNTSSSHATIENTVDAILKLTKCSKP